MTLCVSGVALVVVQSCFWIRAGPCSTLRTHVSEGSCCAACERHSGDIDQAGDGDRDDRELHRGGGHFRQNLR